MQLHGSLPTCILCGAGAEGPPYPLMGNRGPKCPTNGTGDGILVLIDSSGRSAGAFRRALLAWYLDSRRDLPWRHTRDPYRIWVSETMLQQTRVETVIERYRLFLEAFPTIEELADADEAAVTAAWSGLGYYRRARALHAAARCVVREHRGVVPDSADVLEELPGIGRYTARAVASIAFDRPVAVVDGNVARVVSRLFAIPSPRPARIQEIADRMLATKRPGDWNQAMMELGATICVPARPRCEDCPVRRYCAARAAGSVEEIPAQRRKAPVRRVETIVWIVTDRRGRIWLEHRGVSPLKGLWVPPWRDAAPAAAAGRHPILGRFDHAITNTRYGCEVRRTSIRPSDLPGVSCGPGRWFGLEEIARLPTSSVTQKSLRLMTRAASAS